MLPFIRDFLGKAGEVFYFDHFTVVKDSLAGEQAEHLVLIAFNKSDVGAGCAVEHGTEAHLEPAVVRSEGPRLHEGFFIAGDVEFHLTELVRLAVVK